MNVRHDRPSSNVEKVIGRTLAMMVHPYAAWRTSSRRQRTIVLACYAAAGYAVVLTLLVTVARP